jgi:hypothetical protein
MANHFSKSRIKSGEVWEESHVRPIPRCNRDGIGACGQKPERMPMESLADAECAKMEQCWR